MESSRSVPREPGTLPSTSAEVQSFSGPSGTPSTTESQLVALLSESRREADSLRRELAVVRKKADADHRRLQALSVKSPDHQVRIFQERLARAEAALEEAESRSRFVERNWLQMERYLTIIQHQAADSRAAFSRLMEQNDGRLVLPNDSPAHRRRDIPLEEYMPSRGSGHHPQSHSNLRRDSASTSSSRSPDYMRQLPLIIPRQRASPLLRSPSGVEDERWQGNERGDRSPPYKRQRTSGRGDEFRQRRSRSPPPAHHRRTPASPPVTVAPRHKRYTEHMSHPSREYMPPPPTPPRPEVPQPYQPSETLRAYDARNPPLQFIPHRHPPVPPRPPTPPVPLQVQPSTSDVPHQYQHRFHLNTGGHGPRRPVRPGAYETIVFALDSDAPTQEVGRVKEE